MTNRTPPDLARRFFVADLSSACIPATRLRNILDSLHQQRPLSNLALDYLQQQGLISLRRLATGEISYGAFTEVAGEEQSARKRKVAAEKIAKEAEQKTREAAWAIQYQHERDLAEQRRLELESDPKYIAKVKNQQLRARYGLDAFIEEHCFGRLMDILRRIDSGTRLTDDDTLWFKTAGKEYFSAPLQAAFHLREAEFFLEEYLRTRDPWMAVNASSHFRKCGKPGEADELLSSMPDDLRRTPKLKSAICTTHGGAMRDMTRWDEALNLGAHAHNLTPRDFRPCTLLGAVSMEIGNFDRAREWYAKAVERGATEHSVDSDMRGIFARADRTRREAIKAYLLREDPVRYRWVHHFDSSKSPSPRR